MSGLCNIYSFLPLLSVVLIEAKKYVLPHSEHTKLNVFLIVALNGSCLCQRTRQSNFVCCKASFKTTNILCVLYKKWIPQ